LFFALERGYGSLGSGPGKIGRGLGNFRNDIGSPGSDLGRNISNSQEKTDNMKFGEYGYSLFKIPCSVFIIKIINEFSIKREENGSRKARRRIAKHAKD